MPATWRKLAYEDDVILKTLYDAYTILYADTNDIPAALVVGASTIVGRGAAGGIVALSKSAAQTVLNVADGATANAKATAAEIDTGTDDVKFATALSISSSKNVPHIAPGASGGVVVSDGTDWVRGASAPATAHDIFSATHGDTTGAAAVVDGDVIIGNATPKWSKLAISIPGGAALLNVFGIITGELRPSWKALFDATNPTTIGVSDAGGPGTATVAAHRDHQHPSPATFPPSSHALSAHTAAAASISMAGYQLTDIVAHLVADAAALAALTGVKGKMAFQLDTAGLYMCTAIA
jgi:hypothetical protein